MACMRVEMGLISAYIRGQVWDVAGRWWYNILKRGDFFRMSLFIAVRLSVEMVAVHFWRCWQALADHFRCVFCIRYFHMSCSCRFEVSVTLLQYEHTFSYHVMLLWLDYIVWDSMFVWFCMFMWFWYKGFHSYGERKCTSRTSVMQIVITQGCFDADLHWRLLIVPCSFFCCRSITERLWNLFEAPDNAHNQEIHAIPLDPYRTERDYQRSSDACASAKDCGMLDHQSETQVRTVLDDGTLCCVCMDALRDTCIFPCGHVALCHECASQLARNSKAKAPDQAGNVCPICRKRIRNVARVYFSWLICCH